MVSSLPASVLARYANARIPRYTSYPTAPHFSPAVGEADYRSWLESLPATKASLYLHVPFCRAMCWYCGCHTTVAAREAPVTRYVSALRKELRLVAGIAAQSLTVSHIHFGGGTPTLMAPDQMRYVMTDLFDLYAIGEGAEVAIEVDPRTLSAEMARTLGECGFNRASIGVQSFDADVQKVINRVQSFEETATAVGRLRASGIRQINFDLIYGLPHQSLPSCLETVERSLQLRPERLAVFGYAHVPSFKPHQRKIDETALPSSESRLEHSRAIAAALIAAGYVEVGFDHFALPGDPLAEAVATGSLHRNFQGYTTDSADVLIGFGASAIGRTPDGFVQNEVRIPAYERAVGDGRLPIARGYRFAGEDRMRAAIIERLMCDRSVDVGAICRSFGASPRELLESDALRRVAIDGLAAIEGERVWVQPHARSFLRSVAAAFDEHLTGAERYSRAV